MSADADLIVWTAQEVEDAGTPARFFDHMARALACYRSVLEVVDVLWGVTRPSPYTKGRSRRAIDPFANDRSRYLVAYPFTKTAEWYLLASEQRQELMNEHIRIGRSHPGIDQLLLYSVGLQNHEFVVVYETEDLERFSALVAELRTTAARPYTARDTPVRVGILQDGQADSR
jgi:chlorite dismutase